MTESADMGTGEIKTESGDDDGNQLRLDNRAMTNLCHSQILERQGLLIHEKLLL